VAQSLVDIGATYGKVDVQAVLPHSSTVSRKTHLVAEKVREKFLPEVKEAIADWRCVFDADGWSDKYTKTSYLTTTAQYVTGDFELKSLVLFTSAFPADEKKTGTFVRKHSDEALEKMGISAAEVKEKVTYVTDEGSNMLTAFAGHNRLSCSAHNLSNVLKHMLNDKFLETDAPSVKTCLQVGKSIVGYLKRSGLCNVLPHSVKSMIEVRWDSAFDMVFSVCDAFPYIMKICKDKKEEHRLDGWDGELMTELCEFLLEFKKVTKELQAKKVPTIQNVVVRYYDLLQHCTPKTTADEDENEVGASEVCSRQFFFCQRLFCLCL